MNEKESTDKFMANMEPCLKQANKKIHISIPYEAVIIEPQILCEKCGNALSFRVSEDSTAQHRPIITVMLCECEREKDRKALIDSLPDLLKKAGYDLDKIKNHK